MKKLLFVLISCILLSFVTMGQYTSSKKRPEWVDGELGNANMRLYNSRLDVVRAKGYSEEDARNNAAKNSILNQSGASGARFSVQVQEGNIVITGNDELTVKSRIIDEYRQKMGPGEYEVTLLVQTAVNPTLALEPVIVTRRYPFSPRILVPGMAQLHKGSTGKGVLFITSEVVFASGAVVFELQRSSNKSKIFKTDVLEERRDYMDKADKMKKLRDGFTIAAAAIYLWNLIDGAAAKGDSHVVVKSPKVKLTPYATAQSAGVSLSLNF